MKAKERFRRMGESRGARGLRWVWAPGLTPDTLPTWACEAYRYGWMLGRIAWIDRTQTRKP